MYLLLSQVAHGVCIILTLLGYNRVPVCYAFEFVYKAWISLGFVGFE